MIVLVIMKSVNGARSCESELLGRKRGKAGIRRKPDGKSGRVDVTSMQSEPIGIEKLFLVLSDEKERVKGKFVVQL